MKNILYKILPVCLLTIGLTGCEDETKISSSAGSCTFDNEHQ